MMKQATKKTAFIFPKDEQHLISNWLTTFGSAMIPSLPITLALTLAVYALVRAIG
jgi:hypothetical protein